MMRDLVMRKYLINNYKVFLVYHPDMQRVDENSIACFLQMQLYYININTTT